MFNKIKEAIKLELYGEEKEWFPVNESIYCGRMSDKDIEEMRERNEKAIAACIKKMGKKWILHPSHKVGRITA
jgi:hypothetical protein